MNDEGGDLAELRMFMTRILFSVEAAFSRASISASSLNDAIVDL